MGAAALAVLVVVLVVILAPAASLGPSPARESLPIASPPASPATSRVDSIPNLLDALEDDSLDVIIVADGTYHVSAAGLVADDSLWIGDRFAHRTRPVTVRAETKGGVTFDGGGGSGYGGLSFEDGAHDQTWDGFNFANMNADKTGIVEIGGYTPRASPYRIALRNITVERSCTGSATGQSSPTLDHAFYVAHALGSGPHDLLFEDIVVDGRGGLASAFHFFHSEPGAPNASHVIVRRLHVIGTQQAIILWDPTLRDITFDEVDIADALTYAVRYETAGATGIVLANIVSSGSGFQGFHSSEGANPAGVTFYNTQFH